MKTETRFRIIEYKDHMEQVEYPYYRHESDGDNDWAPDIYWKILSPSRSVMIKFYSAGEAGVSISQEVTVLCSKDLDYLLGRGPYACTAEEFEAALDRARNVLDADLNGGGSHVDNN